MTSTKNAKSTIEEHPRTDPLCSVLVVRGDVSVLPGVEVVGSWNVNGGHVAVLSALDRALVGDTLEGMRRMLARALPGQDVPGV